MSEDAVDLKDVLERVQGDVELLKELFQIYSEDFVEKRKALTLAIEKNDYEQVKSIAHSLKGASGNISAKKLYASFLNLEQIGKGSDLSKAPELLARIDVQYQELQKFISEYK